jgi:hypothetical protein
VCVMHKTCTLYRKKVVKIGLCIIGLIWKFIYWNRFVVGIMELRLVWIKSAKLNSSWLNLYWFWVIEFFSIGNWFVWFSSKLNSGCYWIWFFVLIGFEYRWERKYLYPIKDLSFSLKEMVMIQGQIFFRR